MCPTWNRKPALHHCDHHDHIELEGRGVNGCWGCGLIFVDNIAKLRVRVTWVARPRLLTCSLNCSNEVTSNDPPTQPGVGVHCVRVKMHVLLGMYFVVLFQVSDLHSLESRAFDQ